MPAFRPDLILTLLAPTFTVAMLGAIESLMSAVVADRMAGTRHNSNVELFAQGLANIASPLVGGLPATGRHRPHRHQRALGRQDAGRGHGARAHAARHPAGRRRRWRPRCRWRCSRASCWSWPSTWGSGTTIPALWKQRWADPLVWLATFALTILADLTVAVEVGMILAALLFISRVASTTTVTRVTGDYVERGRPHILQDKAIPDYVTVLRIHGPFLFGATDKLADLTAEIPDYGEIVALRLRNMTALDATGLRAIQDFADALQASGRTLLLCGALPQPSALMDRAEFHRHVGEENILPQRGRGAGAGARDPRRAVRTSA